MNRSFYLSILFCLLIAALLISSNIGAFSLTWHDLAQADFKDSTWQIWLNIRLPRILLAVVVGLALAVSGALFQGLFHNPMADPALIGVNSGASLAVALSILLPNLLPQAWLIYGTMLIAFLGSLTVSTLIYALSYRAHASMQKLLLAGIAVNALCFALVGMLTYISNDQQLRQFTLWTMGSLGQAQWQPLIAASLVILPLAAYSFTLAKQLNLLQLGDEEAHYLGLDVINLKKRLIFLGALLVGAAVAVSGAIGFIGLLIPHLIRFKFGADHRWVLPASAIAGAILLLVADTLARTAFAPAELPVGMLTSFLGAPYFLWLVIKYKEER
ncbi:Hemin transport system permease protein hmuU [Bibersteinia trehalosi USDA-ARS-USMARC-188]|nr:iron ABC transporter permease [Bibersteinia trehalosi]AHG82558.1 Hemin transport system permease protein hmuU [Bibersteinia trehalosi USDA-ARS-USMARC-188]AHG85625.1 Hemin transport system permease protein hmuU [Bibersteinia trehalosi USDA-ARS-USMARC-190]TCT14122.1 iron complex transport system permease protein [Bibersteinia trehalosi]